MDISRIPRIRPQAAQGRRGMERPCPNLHIERLEDHTALLRPIIMEREDQLLEAFGFRIGSGIGHLFAFALAQIWAKPLAHGPDEVKGVAG